MNRTSREFGTAQKYIANIRMNGDAMKSATCEIDKPPKLFIQTIAL
jgi:hypothetical protein